MKISNYSLVLLPQEAVEMLNQIQTVINYGKYQWPVVTTTPTWTGRQGENVWVINATSRILMACASDQSSTSWVVVAGS